MKYKFKQTPNQTVRKFTSGNIGTGSLFRSDKNLEAYRVSRKHLYFLSAFLGSSFFKPSWMPWHLHCLNPQWSLQVLKLEVRSHGRSRNVCRGWKSPLPRCPIIISDVLPPLGHRGGCRYTPCPQTSLPFSPERNLFSFLSRSLLSLKELIQFLYFPFPSTPNILHYCFIGLRSKRNSKVIDFRLQVWSDSCYIIWM